MARRNKIQRAKDYEIIANLYLSGVGQIQIAEELGLSQQMISKELKVLQSLWLESSMVDFNQSRAEELAKIDKLEREYYQAWLASKSDKVEKSVEEKPSKEEEKGAKTYKTKSISNVGDVRFLNGIEWCIDKRCMIKGVEAPKVIQIETWKDDVIMLLRNGEIGFEELQDQFMYDEIVDLYRSAGKKMPASQTVIDYHEKNELEDIMAQRVFETQMPFEELLELLGAENEETAYRIFDAAGQKVVASIQIPESASESK